jgi:translation initiation factor 2B subunit (eIF-2B alpha/beta/delta family)
MVQCRLRQRHVPDGERIERAGEERHDPRVGAGQFRSKPEDRLGRLSELLEERVERHRTYDALVDDVWATLSSIAADRESGAAQIAAAAAEALKDVTPREMQAAIRKLLAGHPSMAPLWRLASQMLSAPDPVRGADDFLPLLESDEVAASLLAPVLPPSLLTLSFSSSVLAAVRRASASELLCMRSEPGGEGGRMAEAARPTPARVIEDDEALELVPAKAVVVGADAVTPSGLVNKVKTRALAESALGKDVPRYVVAGQTKFVGADLPVGSPFETVPLELFTAIATPFGLLSPSQAEEVASGAFLHPDLAEVLLGLGSP